MTQHTPGPWDATGIEEGDLAESYYVANGERRICLIAGYGERRRSKSPKTDEVLTAEDVANARLIAAAPDLLETACRTLDLLEDLGVDSGIPGVANMLRDAIAKATGENLQKSP